MPQQQRIRLTPSQIAEQAKPNWRVASAPYKADAAEPRAVPDAVSPEVNDLMKKYFGSFETDTANRC